MASTEASSEQATARAGEAAGRDDSRSPRIALSERLPRPWLFPLLVFGLTWALIFATWQVANVVYGKSEPWTFFFMFKDANHYLDIARNGYPAVLHFPPKAHPPGYPPTELISRPGTWWSWLLYKPRVTYHGPYPFVPAFFPLFPGLIWLLHWVAGGSFLGGALLAQVLSGAASALLVWLLAARVRGRRVADRAVIAFCAFPGAMTFGMLYSEPLAIAIAAATLLAMLGRRWVLAGLLAAVGTAERPTLIVLTGVLAVGALVAIRDRREWRSLVAAPMSLAGAAGYFAWLGLRYHNADFWFATERRGWNQSVDFGMHTFQLLTWQLSSVTSKHTIFNALLIVMFVAGIAGIVLMIVDRLPWPLTLFTVLTFLACIVSTAQSTKPRFVWSAFGIFIAMGSRLPRFVFWPLVVVSAGLLAFLIGWWPHHYVGPAP
jgi:hypothetical protein